MEEEKKSEIYEINATNPTKSEETQAETAHEKKPPLNAEISTMPTFLALNPEMNRANILKTDFTSRFDVSQTAETVQNSAHSIDETEYTENPLQKSQELKPSPLPEIETSDGEDAMEAYIPLQSVYISEHEFQGTSGKNAAKTPDDEKKPA
eukprot:Sdes_comp10975_c0_seq1m2614